MNNIENVAEELFNKIRSRFDKIVIGDENGKATDDPEQARFFNFNYTTSDGVKHGSVSINIVDGKSLKIMFSNNIKMDEIQEQQWEQFLRSIRNFAKRNLMTFDVRDINRDNLTKRDIKQISKTTIAYNSKEAPVNESIEWQGTTRTSIQNFGPTRLIVRHSEAVDESKPNSRSRKIESMFVETDQGERFRMPYNKLSLGRAMAQHLAHGGRIYDEAGQHIQEMAEEMNNLSFFVRNTRHRQFEDIETTGMVESAIDRYRILKNNLNRLTKTRNYQKFAETFVPELAVEDDYDLDALKERFVKKMFDDRLTDALPYVYRAYQSRQVGENKFIGEFDQWTDSLLDEDSLDDIDLDLLKNLMSSPIKSGQDGIDAINALRSVVNNDELVDLIGQFAQSAGPEADTRQVIDDWLIDNYPEYSTMIPPQPDSQSVDQTPTDSQDQKRAFENLKRLAGLIK